MHALHLEIRIFTKNFADNSDQWQMQRQERRRLSETKEARKTRREQLIETNQLYEKAESLLFGSNITD